MAGLGKAGSGRVWLGLARAPMVQMNQECLGHGAARRGRVRLGWVGRGSVGLGMVGSGRVWQGSQWLINYRGQRMYSESKDLKKNVKNIVDFCANLNRGGMLLLTDIERVTFTERYTGRWLSIIAKLKRHLLNSRRIALRPIKGVGYRLCEPSEQLEWGATDRQKRATRQLTRGIHTIMVIGADELSDHEQRLRVAQMSMMTSSRKQIKRSRRYLSQEIRKTETMPMMATA